MSDFYNYHEDDQKRPEQSANDYNYYQQTSDGARRTYSPYDTPEPNKSEKKKGYFRYWAPGRVIEHDGKFYLYVTFVKPGDRRLDGGDER